MLQLLLLTALLTTCCIGFKAYLSYLDYKHYLHENNHAGSSYPPISRQQRN